MSTSNGERNQNDGSSNLPPSYRQHQGTNGHPPSEKRLHMNEEKPTNEYVLNVAFFSFFGFMLVQAGFAIMVGSQSMLADSEAMGVDAMTYLFNLCAERIKNRPYSSKELQKPPNVREYKRTLRRLYLELIPPLISVSTLIAVTIVTLHDSMRTLYGNDDNDTNGKPQDEMSQEEGDEMVGVMLFFSTLNLLLDVVNVACFARANQAYVNVLQSQDVQEEFKRSIRPRTPSEDLSLLVANAQGEIEIEKVHGYGTNGDTYEGAMAKSDESQALVNLNMCSAWTHVCADTMRSIAVLVAAGIAYLFDAVTPQVADATAAVVVSCIIIVSLLPLLQGLYLTATEIWILTRRPPSHGEAGMSLTV